MENKIKELQEMVDKISKTIQELSEQVEPKQPFKNGDVVEYKSITIKITNAEKGEGYGLNTLGEWVIQTWSFRTNPNFWQLSTPEKWLEVCTKEAEKRGFKEGVKFISMYSGMESKVSDLIFSTDKIGGSYLLLCDNNCIMKDGIWATVLPKDKTLEELFKVKFAHLDYFRFIEELESNPEAYIKALQNLKN